MKIGLQAFILLTIKAKTTHFLLEQEAPKSPFQHLLNFKIETDLVPGYANRH